MNELEQMCQEMDKIAIKYGFAFISDISLKAVNENKIGTDLDLATIKYNRHI